MGIARVPACVIKVTRLFDASGLAAGRQPMSRHWTTLHSSVAQHTRVWAEAAAKALTLKASASSSERKNFMVEV